MAITRRQHELYDFISRFVAEKQYSPGYNNYRSRLPRDAKEEAAETSGGSCSL
jgi:SOS-response transcriptional repressor LexA